MRRSLLTAVVVVTLFALFIGGGVASAEQPVIVRLEPVEGSGIRGIATLSASGDGTQVVLELAGLSPGASYLAHAHTGATCDDASVHFSRLPTLVADDAGRVTVAGVVRFRDTEDVALATIGDGDHIIDIHPTEGSDAGASIACGTVPKVRLPGTDAPAELPAAAVGAVGGLALGGLLLRRR